MNTPSAVSTEWLLLLLAGMRFPEPGGAYDFVKRAIAERGEPAQRVVHRALDLSKTDTRCGHVLRPGEWRATNDAHVTCEACKSKEGA